MSKTIRQDESGAPYSGLGVFFQQLLVNSTDLSIFADAGVAWDSSSKLVWKQTAEAADEGVPFLSTGLSLRLNWFGAMVIESFYALGRRPF